MRLLLDTHILLWSVEGDEHLSAHARALIQSAEKVYVSSVSIWEVAIKAAIGKLQIDASDLARQLLLDGFAQLPITHAHAVVVQSLPLHHRDPFDRLLIAQAMTEGMRLLTADAHLAAYSDLVVVI